jgi:predicted AAA+ superfamily ATPase
MEAVRLPAHFASADEPTLRDRIWIEQQWDLARLKARDAKTSALLVLDEVQKVSGWPDSVKLLWDADTHARLPLKVVLLSSAPLLIQRGLTESLAGRFEIIRVPHWSTSPAAGSTTPCASKPSNAPVVAEALRTRSSALRISEVSLWSLL